MQILQPLVYVIILNWNKPDVTITCIQSLKHSDYQNYRIVLIDNSSSEQLKLFASQDEINVVYISNQKNLGFTGGVNQGLEFAMEHGADYVWLLNNDVEVTSDCLENLVKEMESDKKIGLISPIILDPEKPKYPFYCKNVDLSTGQMLNAFDEQTYIDWLTKEPWNIHLWGTALLINKDLIHSIGYLDNDFFAYYEDNNYSFRSIQAGFCNKTCTNAIVIHRSETDIYNEKMSYRFFLIARNHYQFWLKAGVDKSKAIIRTLKVFIPKIIHLHREGNEIVGKPYLGGLWQGIIKNTFGPPPQNLFAPKFVYRFTVVFIGMVNDVSSKFRQIL